MNFRQAASCASQCHVYLIGPYLRVVSVQTHTQTSLLPLEGLRRI